MIPFDRYAKQIALVDSDEKRVYTYIEVKNEVFVWTQHLPVERSLILYFTHNSVKDVVAYLAGLESIHVVCLCDAALPKELKQVLIEQYRPAATVENGVLQKTNFAPISLHPDLKLLLSTSGTTGSPKMVRLSMSNVLANAEAICTYLKITPRDVAIASLPFFYSYGLSILHTHLLAGASVILTSSSVVQAGFWQAMQTYKCTSFAGVPHTYRLLQTLKFDQIPLPDLKVMTQAGGALEKGAILEFWKLMQARGGLFYSMYGQTEATARIAFLDPSRLPEKAGSIGRAIPGGTLDLQDGELVYQGPNVMLGYAESFADLEAGDLLQGILHTGDLAECDEEGDYTITGRLKRISKVYGYRINLDDLERALDGAGKVAITSDDLKIFLFVEEGTVEQIERYIKLLSQHTHLHYTTFEGKSLQTLPRTASGKINYRELI